MNIVKRIEEYAREIQLKHSMKMLGHEVTKLPKVILNKWYWDESTKRKIKALRTDKQTVLMIDEMGDKRIVNKWIWQSDMRHGIIRSNRGCSSEGHAPSLNECLCKKRELHRHCIRCKKVIKSEGNIYS